MRTARLPTRTSVMAPDLARRTVVDSETLRSLAASLWSSRGESGAHSPVVSPATLMPGPS
jgi:hypothetical protein